MTWTISKDFAFSASHALTGLPDDHPCSRLHGHNYVVRVELSSTKLDEFGMVLDYGKLKVFEEWLEANLDHRHLNDVLVHSPTAENLAGVLGELALWRALLRSGVHLRVGVAETPKTWAWWAETPEAKSWWRP